MLTITITLFAGIVIASLKPVRNAIETIVQGAKDGADAAVAKQRGAVMPFRRQEP